MNNVVWSQYLFDILANSDILQMRLYEREVLKTQSPCCINIPCKSIFGSIQGMEIDAHRSHDGVYNASMCQVQWGSLDGIPTTCNQMAQGWRRVQTCRKQTEVANMFQMPHSSKGETCVIDDISKWNDLEPPVWSPPLPPMFPRYPGLSSGEMQVVLAWSFVFCCFVFDWHEKKEIGSEWLSQADIGTTETPMHGSIIHCFFLSCLWLLTVAAPHTWFIYVCSANPLLLSNMPLTLCAGKAHEPLNTCILHLLSFHHDVPW